MALRSGMYIVTTDRWYIERAVWLIAGLFPLAFTALAALRRPGWALAITALGVDRRQDEDDFGRRRTAGAQERLRVARA
jgi:hypothetical protein